MDSLFSIIGFIYFATSVKENYLPENKRNKETKASSVVINTKSLKKSFILRNIITLIE